MTMQFTQIHSEPRKIWWRCWCLLLVLGGGAQVQGQSVETALKAGQTLQVEWIQQNLNDRKVDPSRTTPLFPDELLPGESETRVGLILRIAEGNRPEAEVAYVKYLAFPEPEYTDVGVDTEGLFVEPTILDTRFRDKYFNPQLSLMNELVQQRLPVACQEVAYQNFLEEFGQMVEQSTANSALLDVQLEWFDRVSLPEPLSAASLATFFCQLREVALPEEESPFLLQTRKQKNRQRVDYLQVDYPEKVCVLRGNIQRPATGEVRVQFYQTGDWLSYWGDSTLQLDRDGNFELAFPLDHPRDITLFHGYRSMRFYFAPGDTLEFRTNGNAFYREMQVAGQGQKDNEFLLDFYHEMRGDSLYRRYDFDLLDRDHKAFFQRARVKEASELAFLADRAPTLRPDFVAWMDRNLKLEHANIQWEAANRFMVGRGISLEPSLLNQLQEKANLLYRLPHGKDFDFKVEEFLAFQFNLLQKTYRAPQLDAREEFALAQLLPSKETFVRHTLMQLFRNYTDLGQLTESGQWRLAQLMSMTRDTQLIREMTVFKEGMRQLPSPVGIRTLQKGNAAPAWSFKNTEGGQVGLEDFLGRKLLLHIGRVDNLDLAITDLQTFRESQDQLPEIVHLLTALDYDEFIKGVAGKQGVFVYVSPEEMEALKESYYVDNYSNHYFFIGEEGKILANHYDLGTARMLRGAWQKITIDQTEGGWNADKNQRFLRGLGAGLLISLIIGGIVLWLRRLQAQRELRRRQLLEVELRGIRSQMNPHFLFNAMSSIQNLIRKEEQEKADLYLGQFAGLMRKTLRNTAEEFIPLTDEIETLEQYCSLESLRHPFHYEFKIDDRLDAHNTYVPSMLLQPIIENAILHGLGPKVGPKELIVTIQPGENGLQCTIQDNGVGVLATQKQKDGKDHRSMGMKLVRQRLDLMGLRGHEHLSITDRSTLNPPAEGTLVYLTIPLEQ
jgi:hypothetical protein